MTISLASCQEKKKGNAHFFYPEIHVHLRWQSHMMKPAPMQPMRKSFMLRIAHPRTDRAGFDAFRRISHNERAQGIGRDMRRACSTIVEK